MFQLFEVGCVIFQMGRDSLGQQLKPYVVFIMSVEKSGHLRAKGHRLAESTTKTSSTLTTRCRISVFFVNFSYCDYSGEMSQYVT